MGTVLLESLREKLLCLLVGAALWIVLAVRLRMQCD